MQDHRASRAEDAPLVVDAHATLLRGMQDGTAPARTRDLLVGRSVAWADDLAAWPLITGLLYYAQRQVHETSSAVRNGTFDDREWLREQRVLALVIDLYDDIRRAVLVRHNPNSGVRAPSGKARR